MYCLVPEKPLRLAPQGHFLRGVYGTFYLAIDDALADLKSVPSGLEEQPFGLCRASFPGLRLLIISLKRSDP